MLGIVILSLIISKILYKSERPKTRASYTVLTAILLQLVFSITFNALLANSLARRGHVVSADIGEAIARWVFTTPIFGGLVWLGLWWWFNRNWIDDDEDAETFY